MEENFNLNFSPALISMWEVKSVYIFYSATYFSNGYHSMLLLFLYLNDTNMRDERRRIIEKFPHIWILCIVVVVITDTTQNPTHLVDMHLEITSICNCYAIYFVTYNRFTILIPGCWMLGYVECYKKNVTLPLSPRQAFVQWKRGER